MKLPDLPNFRLDQKRAIVTGAGRGIGLAAATALAKSGAHVTLVARSYNEIDAAAKELNASGCSAQAVTLDVTDISAVTDFFAQQDTFDVLVNNAGTNRPKSILDASEDDFDAVINLNLKSAFFVSRECAKKMVANNVPGSLIHIGSQMGHVGGANRSLYCASKWGLEGLNKAIALDLAGHKIRSNTIAPTFIETPLTRPFFEDKQFKDNVLKKIKLGRIGQVEDLMGAIIYLASDASSLVTGTSIVVDGGWTAD
jgi:NAD(P)-dependent dehydrogenase (short-subunit alcohol dehydrogenase family)